MKIISCKDTIIFLYVLFKLLKRFIYICVHMYIHIYIYGYIDILIAVYGFLDICVKDSF